MVVPESKSCPRCDQVKPASDYSLDRCQPDGLQRYCKSCVSETRKVSSRRSTHETDTESPEIGQRCVVPCQQVFETSISLLMEQFNSYFHTFGILVKRFFVLTLSMTPETCINSRLGLAFSRDRLAKRLYKLFNVAVKRGQIPPSVPWPPG